MDVATIDNRAWQPLTPKGVAAFARDSVWRLLLCQFVFALMAAAAVAWFIDDAWTPAIREAVGNLPPEGAIRGGILQWHGSSPQVLADNHFLSLIVDLDHSGEARSPANIQVEFGRSDVRVFSLFGYVPISYPPSWTISFNQRALLPLWGAWRPPLLWLAAVATLVGVMSIWGALTALYFWPVSVIGLFADRDLNYRASAKLAGAALMPGAVVMTAGIILYGAGILDLLQFTAVFGIHFLVGWCYAFVSPFFVSNPKAAKRKKNPFAASRGKR